MLCVECSDRCTRNVLDEENVYHCKVCVHGKAMDVATESKNNESKRVKGFMYLGDKLNAGVSV